MTVRATREAKCLLLREQDPQRDSVPVPCGQGGSTAGDGISDTQGLGQEDSHAREKWRMTSFLGRETQVSAHLPNPEMFMLRTVRLMHAD